MEIRPGSIIQAFSAKRIKRFYRGIFLPERPEITVKQRITPADYRGRFDRLKAAHRDVFRKVSKELTFDPAINYQVLRLSVHYLRRKAIKTGEPKRKLTPADVMRSVFFALLSNPILKDKEGLNKPENEAKLRDFNRLFCAAAEFCNRKNINIMTFFEFGIGQTLVFAPQLAEYRNIGALREFIKFALRTSLKSDCDPGMMMHSAIIALVQYRPQLLEKGYRQVLRQILEFCVGISDRGKDTTWLLGNGIAPLLRRNPALIEPENNQILSLLFDYANKAFEKGHSPLEIFEDILIPLFKSNGSLARAANIQKLHEALDTADILLGSGIQPTSHLIDLLSNRKFPVEQLLERFSYLYSLQRPEFPFKGQTDLDLYYSVLKKKAGQSIEMPSMKEYKELVQKIIDWQRSNPDFSVIKNDSPVFSATGKEEVEVPNRELDKALIGMHIDKLDYEINGAAFDEFGFLSSPILTQEENLLFIKRTLAHLQIQGAIRDTLLPPDFAITASAVRRHIFERQPERFAKSREEMIREINKSSKFDMAVATYFACHTGMTEAQTARQEEKAEFFRSTIALLLLSEGLRDPQLKRMLKSELLQVKLAALTQVYLDRATHIPDASLPLPSDIALQIRQRYNELRTEFQKIGLASKHAKDCVYTIEPWGTESVLRGYVGADCASEDNIPLWAFNPNNLFFLIKKGDENKGYIGMTRCSTPEGRIVMLVDTMQPCPPSLVEPVLRSLETLAKKMGYDGLALPADLKPSFNYEQTKLAVQNLDAYKNGKETKLKPEDRTSWRIFTEKLGKDKYHSLNKCKGFIVLSFTPLPGTHPQ